MAHDHDYTRDDTEAPDDAETMLQAVETLKFGVQEDRLPLTEEAIRAYFHNGDYSYSSATIDELVKKFAKD